MNNWSKRKVFNLLNNIHKGFLVINEGNQVHQFGEPSSTTTATIQIYDQCVYRTLVTSGTYGAAMAYLKNRWECDNLFSLFDIILKNKTTFKKMDSGFARLLLVSDFLKSFFSKNSISKAKRHILAHYDLSNHFFKEILDDTMMYSCALFESEHQELKGASINKLQAICDKLQLTSQDRVLEIGTGWGGFAIYAAEKYGCNVTTTTISNQQYQYALHQVKEKKLDSKITILNKDYRLLEGEYDKIVSIEMIEAIGFHLYQDYFRKIDSLLKEGGLFTLQCITINDKDYERAKYEVDFMKKFIFPGGTLPSISKLLKITGKKTNLQLLSLHDIGHHYVKTLASWQQNFKKNIQKIYSLGFDNRFVKMWDYYFCYCQAGFKHKHISDIQVTWQKII